MFSTKGQLFNSIFDSIKLVLKHFQNPKLLYLLICKIEVQSGDSDYQKESPRDTCDDLPVARTHRSGCYAKCPGCINRISTPLRTRLPLGIGKLIPRPQRGCGCVILKIWWRASLCARGAVGYVCVFFLRFFICRFSKRRDHVSLRLRALQATKVRTRWPSRIYLQI